MNKNISIVLLVTVAALAGLFFGNLLASRAGGVSVMSNGSNTFNEIISLIDNKYVDTVDVKKITEETMTDLVSKLDPHSVFIPSSDVESVNSDLEGSFSGIGVQFNIQNDTVMIIAVISGGPSEKVGVLAGDRIVKVNDTSFVGKTVTNEKVMKKLRGKEGTKVKLGIRRHGTKELLSYTITRGEIPVNSVDISYMIEPKVGYIRVSKFAATTYKEFLDAIASLRTQGAERYVVDLRQNSGGYLEQAVQMVNEFLPEGQMIVYSKGNAYPRAESRANGKGSCIKQPLVVMIDEYSASASEIFSGAIQDNDRGVIVGRRSFGKGLVQQQMPLSDGSALRLTVARYYTPSGRSIQKPYVKGKSEDYQLDLLNRYKRGEFDSKDSIRMVDSLKYKTLKGRIVYGGGGIMPDVFIPRDTSDYTPYLNKVVNYGYVYQYAFQYADQHRAMLKSFKTWQQLEAHLKSQDILSGFVSFASSKGVPMVPKEIQTSKRYLLNQLHAFIIRDLMGDKGFYPVINKDDKTIHAALEQIKKIKL